jgi:predicted nucleic-acid-binding protein
MEEFATGTAAALAELKETTAAHLEDQAVQLESRESELAKLVSERTEQSGAAMKMVKEGIEDLLSGYFAEQSAALVSDVGDVQARCKISAAASRTYASECTTALDATTASIHDFSGESQRNVMDAVANVQSTADRSAEQTFSVLKTIVSTQEAVVEHQDVMTVGIAEFANRSKAAIETVRGLHSAYAERVTATVSTEAAALREACSSLASSTDAAATAMAYFGSETGGQVQAVRDDGRMHAQTAVVEFHQIATDVTNHITTNLQSVVPTGDTPMRQVYSYETNLAKVRETATVIKLLSLCASAGVFFGWWYHGHMCGDVCECE